MNMPAKWRARKADDAGLEEINVKILLAAMPAMAMLLVVMVIVVVVCELCKKVTRYPETPDHKYTTDSSKNYYYFVHHPTCFT